MQHTNNKELNWIIIIIIFFFFFLEEIQILYEILAYKSAITNMALVQNFEVMSDKFNVNKIYLRSTFFPIRK
jgi:hypothetical protein